MESLVPSNISQLDSRDSKGNNKKEVNSGGSDNGNGDNGNECTICHDVFNKPITLPCKHRFCSDCLEQWRSKYVLDRSNISKTCPFCRAKIPVTRSMIVQLEMQRSLRADIEEQLNNSNSGRRPCPLPALPGKIGYSFSQSHYGNISDEEIRRVLCLPPDLQQKTLRKRLEITHQRIDRQIRDLEEQIGDVTEVLEEHKELICDELPTDIVTACEQNNVEAVLNWLGVGASAGDQPHVAITMLPTTVLPKRINAQNRESMELTLLHYASKECNLELMRLLLQYGANVDALDAIGLSPLVVSCYFKPLYSSALLLLEWGADKDITFEHNMKAIDVAQQEGHAKLANLLKSPLGGRRCEIHGLQSRSDLNGRTCVVEMYFPDLDRYAVRIIGEDYHEHPSSSCNGNGNGNGILQRVKVKSANLKRRDRRPEDPGVVFQFLGRDLETNRIKWGIQYF